MTSPDTSSTTGGWHFRRRMVSGLVALIPIVVTIAVLRFVINFMAGILLPFIDPVMGAWPGWARVLLSLGILFVAIYLLGSVATNLIGRRIIGVGESVVMRVPFVKVIYSATKQVAAALESREARAFKSVVLVEFPREGMRTLGFVTSSIEAADGNWSTVFIPTSPNPMSGFLQVVHESDLLSTTFTVEEGFKMVMSMGVLIPKSGMPALG